MVPLASAVPPALLFQLPQARVLGLVPVLLAPALRERLLLLLRRPRLLPRLVLRPVP